MSDTTPRHLRPENCYVCGGEPHADRSEHNFWSNVDAAAHFAAEGRRMAAPVYSTGARTPEAAYVDQHIGQ